MFRSPLRAYLVSERSMSLDGSPPAGWSLAGQRDRPLGPRHRERLRSADEVAEQRVRARRPRTQLGVELPGHEERMAVELDDLDEAGVGGKTREHHAPPRQRL